MSQSWQAWAAHDDPRVAPLSHADEANPFVKGFDKTRS